MIHDAHFTGYYAQNTPWSTRFTEEDKAYFKFTGSNSLAILTALFDGNTEQAQYVNTRGVWTMIVGSYTEQHAEAADVQDVLSDTFVASTFGAMPVMINIGGWLWTTPKDDHRLNFLSVYHKGLRGSVLSRSGLSLRFHLKNTIMQLRLTDLTMSTNSEGQDITPFSLSGIGYKYRVI
jgi:hypothetical protein